MASACLTLRLVQSPRTSVMVAPSERSGQGSATRTRARPSGTRSASRTPSTRARRPARRSVACSRGSALESPDNSVVVVVDQEPDIVCLVPVGAGPSAVPLRSVIELDRRGVSGAPDVLPAAADDPVPARRLRSCPNAKQERHGPDCATRCRLRAGRQGFWMHRDSGNREPCGACVSEGR